MGGLSQVESNWADKGRTVGHWNYGVSKKLKWKWKHSDEN